VGAVLAKRTAVNAEFTMCGVARERLGTTPKMIGLISAAALQVNRLAPGKRLKRRTGCVAAPVHSVIACQRAILSRIAPKVAPGPPLTNSRRVF